MRQAPPMRLGRQAIQAADEHGTTSADPSLLRAPGSGAQAPGLATPEAAPAWTLLPDLVPPDPPFAREHSAVLDAVRGEPWVPGPPATREESELSEEPRAYMVSDPGQHDAGPAGEQPGPTRRTTTARGARGGTVPLPAKPEPARPEACGPGRGAAASPQKPPGKVKVCIHYEEGDHPMAELIRLGGGQGADVLVEAVTPGSKAEKAGIRAGYALTSMNGRSEFMQLPGWQVRLLLEAPITLGFDPEPVQPASMKCTEIRLTRAQETLGIPPRVAVCGPKDSGVLAEEVVFMQNAAPIWLSAWGDEHVGHLPEVGAHDPIPRLYELRRPEAHAIVGHAIRNVRDKLDETEMPFEAEWFASAGSQTARRGPAVLCSADCVTECLESELLMDDQPRRPEPAESRSPRRATARAGAGAAAAPVKPPSQRFGPQASTALAAPAGEEQQGRAAAGDPKGRGDRSPMRWLAPVIEGIWGQSPSPGESPPLPARNSRPAAGSPRLVFGSPRRINAGRGLDAAWTPASPKPLSATGDSGFTELDHPLAIGSTCACVEPAGGPAEPVSPDGNGFSVLPPALIDVI